jgi:hypothetical protein
MRVGEARPQAEPRATTAGRFGDALERAGSRAGEKRTRGGPETLRRTGEPARGTGELLQPAQETPAALVGARTQLLPPTPELAAVARAVPVAIAARGGLADGAPLALSFGRSLDVELRAGPAGIELTLLPDARLSRAAEAELPRVVAALRQRGVAVARAEVRPRTGGRAR